MRKRILAFILAALALCTAAFADFSDVSQDAWYYDAVDWAQENGIMDGVSDGVFNPDGSMTRAMLVTILYRLTGEPDMPESDWGYPYSDVAADSWYAVPVYWARYNGIADGVSDTQFDPDGSITREQLVTMLWRYDGEEEPSTQSSFADEAEISAWALYAVDWAAEAGIVSGRDGNVFDPGGSASRAECAAILMRYDAYSEPEPEYTPDLGAIPVNSYDSDDFYITDEGYLAYGSDSLVGIDVSYHQGEIDWEAVAEDGIDFAIIRVGYRGYSEGVIYQDPYFEDNILGALENGIEVGVYFFSQAVTVEEAIQEADATLDWIEGYDISFPVVFDWERISYSSSRTADTSSVTVTDCALAFCGMIEEAGYTAMTYGSPNTVNEDLYIDRLLDYPFWLAHYTTDWAVTDYPYHYDMWQYTSEGSVDGIEGRVDLNVCIGDIYA